MAASAVACSFSIAIPWNVNFLTLIVSASAEIIVWRPSGPKMLCDKSNSCRFRDARMPYDNSVIPLSAKPASTTLSDTNESIFCKQFDK